METVTAQIDNLTLVDTIQEENVEMKTEDNAETEIKTGLPKWKTDFGETLNESVHDEFVIHGGSHIANGFYYDVLQNTGLDIKGPYGTGPDLQYFPIYVSITDKSILITNLDDSGREPNTDAMIISCMAHCMSEEQQSEVVMMVMQYDTFRKGNQCKASLWLEVENYHNVINSKEYDLVIPLTVLTNPLEHIRYYIHN